jgi:hypothetical protein
MRRSFVSVSAAVLGATLLCAPVSAQDTVHAAITGAAVGAVASELRTGEGLPRGRIGFDGRVLEPRPAPASGPDAIAYVLGSATHPERLYAMLDADHADFEGSVVCETDSPRSCRLRGVVAVLAASDPAVTSSGAQVVVAARWRSELAKMPVGYARYVVTLSRARSGEWVVCGIRTQMIS